MTTRDRSSAAPPSELAELGVLLSDRVESFWSMIASRLPAASSLKYRELSDELETEFACVSVGSMRNPDLSAKIFEELLEKHGGSKKWLRSVEHLLGFTFTPSTGSDPPSAFMLSVSQTESELLGNQTGPPREGTPSFGGLKVGEYLKLRRELHRLAFPRRIVIECLEETPDWSESRLSYNDKKAVMAAIFAWVVCTFKSVRKCITMFVELAGHLHNVFPKHSKKGFIKSLRYRWKNGTRASAKVQPVPPMLQPLLPRAWVPLLLLDLHTSH